MFPSYYGGPKQLRVRDPKTKFTPATIAAMGNFMFGMTDGNGDSKCGRFADGFIFEGCFGIDKVNFSLYL
jgi:hypothetical protein